MPTYMVVYQAQRAVHENEKIFFDTQTTLKKSLSKFLLKDLVKKLLKKTERS